MSSTLSGLSTALVLGAGLAAGQPAQAAEVDFNMLALLDSQGNFIESFANPITLAKFTVIDAALAAGASFSAASDGTSWSGLTGNPSAFGTICVGYGSVECFNPGALSSPPAGAYTLSIDASHVDGLSIAFQFDGLSVDLQDIAGGYHLESYTNPADPLCKTGCQAYGYWSSTIPEPPAWALLAIGLFALLPLRRRISLGLKA